MFCVDIHTSTPNGESRSQIAITNGSIKSVMAAIGLMATIRNGLQSDGWEIVYVSDNKTTFHHPSLPVVTSFTVFDMIGVDIKFIK